MIYISTGGEKSKTGYESALNYFKHGIKAVELSGGIHDTNQIEKLKSLIPKLSLQIHNYFPPPKTPFVLNLASLDTDIYEKSKFHIKNAIKFAIQLGRPIYSFHAGFLFDPNHLQLGNAIDKKSISNRKYILNLFINRVKEIAKEFEKFNVLLLIENNVLTKKNFKTFNGNPFLLVDSLECQYFMNQMPENVKLLIDVAHLKVSANTLGFKPEDMLIDCGKWSYAYHLSDNDGITDSNSPITNNSWFWKYLNPKATFYVLEVYGINENELKKQVKIVQDFLNK